MRPDSAGQSFIAQARRAQLIQAAVRVLVTYGYQATSLARIATEAGVAKGVISYHFANKDELMEQVVIDAFVRGAQFMAPRIEAAPDPRGKLRAYLQSNLEFLDQNRDQLVALVEVILNLRGPDGGLRFAAEDSNQAIGPLVALLKAGQDSGDFADFDPKSVAYLLRDAIDGVGGRLRANPEFDILGFADQLITFAERAIHRSPSQPISPADPSDSAGPSDRT